MNLPKTHVTRKEVAYPSDHALEACCRQLVQDLPSFPYGGVEFTWLGGLANRSPEGSLIKPHRHSYTEIIVILTGEAEETSPPHGRLVPGMIQVHGHNVLHSWRSMRGGLTRIGMRFSVHPAVPVTIPAEWPKHPELPAAIHGLVSEALSTAPGRRERLLARLILLLAPALTLFDLPEDSSPFTPPSEPLARDLALFVEQFLTDNLTEPLALRDVAAQLNISVATLTRRFRAAADCSVMERLHALRMNRAAELLRHGELSVKQVAAAVGIPEPSYFCRCFRQAFGCSPRRFVPGAWTVLPPIGAGCGKSRAGSPPGRTVPARGCDPRRHGSFWRDEG